MQSSKRPTSGIEEDMSCAFGYSIHFGEKEGRLSGFETIAVKTCDGMYRKFEPG